MGVYCIKSAAKIDLLVTRILAAKMMTQNSEVKTDSLQAPQNSAVKLIRCGHHNSTAKTDSPLTIQFNSEN
jgi:hypothetical protein